MSILERFQTNKEQELEERKKLVPLEKFRRSIHFEASTVSLTQFLQREDKSGVIAEFKRASPSKGSIAPHAEAGETTLRYMQGGAAALSVLTDGPMFDGSMEDLQEARRFNYCPILRKDLIIDPYQLYEARAYGADAVLLVDRALSEEQARDLAAQAKDLGLEVLFEIDEPDGAQRIPQEADLLGINNRDLTWGSVDPTRAGGILPELDVKLPLVAESGIEDPSTAAVLRKKGFTGILIGTAFMSEPDPGDACRAFVRKLEERTLNEEKTTT
jgi:indole-3-glycerol phosphate synthase